MSSQDPDRYVSTRATGLPQIIITPEFREAFWGAIADQCDRAAEPPVTIHTDEDLIQVEFDEARRSVAFPFDGFDPRVIDDDPTIRFTGLEKPLRPPTTGAYFEVLRLGGRLVAASIVLVGEGGANPKSVPIDDSVILELGKPLYEFATGESLD